MSVRDAVDVGFGGAAGVWRRRAGLLALYVLVATVLVGPALLDPAHRLVGGVRTDAPNTPWSLWFVAESLADGTLPLQTTLLAHPDGGRIAVADPINCLLAVPLTLGVGPVAAWNLLAFAHIVFAGLAAHALGRRLGGTGWVAGVGYAMAPILVSHLQNGSSEAVSAGWLPLALLATLEAVERGGRWRILGAAAALTAGAVGGWYAGVGAFAWTVILGLWGGGPAPLRNASSGGRAVLDTPDGALRGVVSPRTRASRALAAIALAMLVVAPVAWATRSLARSDDGLVEIKSSADLARVRRTLGGADPRGFFVPGGFRSPDFARLEANPSDRVHTTYLGWTLLAVATAGRVARRRASGDDRARVARLPGGDAPAGVQTGASAAHDGAAHPHAATGGAPALLVTGLVCAILALGPVVVWNGAPLAVAGRALPLPYALLEAFPGFDALSLLYRLSTTTALCLAVLADRAAARWSRLVVTGIVLAVFVEVRFLSPVAGLPDVAHVPDRAALTTLAQAPAGAVLNLPVRAGMNFLDEQIVHGKPVCGALNSSVNVAGLKILDAAGKLRRQELTPADVERVARQNGVRYVVFHSGVFGDDVFVGASTAIRGAFPRLAADEHVVIHQLW